MIAARSVTSTDIGWHSGLTDWQPLNTFLPIPAQVPVSVPPPVPAPIPSSPVRGTPSCNVCKSRNTVLCSFVHAQGVSTKSLSGGAVTGGIGGVGGALFSSLGGIAFKGGATSVSGVAAMCAPPERPKEKRMSIIWIGLFTLYSCGIWYFFWFLPDSERKKKEFRAAMERYKSEMLAYQRKWICLDCGTIAEVSG